MGRAYGGTGSGEKPHPRGYPIRRIRLAFSANPISTGFNEWMRVVRAGSSGKGPNAMTTRTTEDVQEINRELLAHNQWLNRKGGRRADLSFQDLSDMTISGIRLAGAKLVGANLVRAKLAGCDMTGAELFGADLEYADLTGANLTGADFRGANLHRATMTDCVLRGADFSTDLATTDTLRRAAHHGPTVMSEARLERAILCEANLSGCDLSGSDLDEANLTGADLSHSVLLGAELGGAVLDDVKLAGTVLEIDRLTADQRAALKDTSGVVAPTYTPLEAGKLAALLAAHDRWIASGGSEGRRLDLEFAGLDEAPLAGCDLSGARLRRCRFRGADLSRARLDMADLSYADLTGAVIEQASLRGANLRRATLTRALLASACLDAMPMAGGRDWPTNLDGAVLHDADLTNASFAMAVLRRADIGGCLLQGVSFRGVDLGVLRRTEPGSQPNGPKERRRARRFNDPALHVRAPFGDFPTSDWSFGGLSIALLNGRVTAALPKRGTTVTLLVGLEGEAAPGVPVSATLTGASAERATLSFRFIKLEEELKTILNPLVPARYRLR
jgi:uncharacterized protein YjbI with pentapeptide repeats